MEVEFITPIIVLTGALTIGIVLMYRSKGKKDTEFTRIKNETLQGKIDFSNIVNSSFNAKPLYDELKIKCHPDKFLEEDKNAKATELFQLLVANKDNYEGLVEIKRMIENELTK